MFTKIHSQATYYWVGGSGNWSDLTHWATTSGGSVKHTIVPSVLNDVVFDASSFTNIIVCDQNNINCSNTNPTNPIVTNAGVDKASAIFT